MASQHSLLRVANISKFTSSTPYAPRTQNKLECCGSYHLYHWGLVWRGQGFGRVVLLGRHVGVFCEVGPSKNKQTPKHTELAPQRRMLRVCVCACAKTKLCQDFLEVMIKRSHAASMVACVSSAQSGPKRMSSYKTTACVVCLVLLTSVLLAW